MGELFAPKWMLRVWKFRYSPASLHKCMVHSNIYIITKQQNDRAYNRQIHRRRHNGGAQRNEHQQVLRLCFITFCHSFFLSTLSTSSGTYWAQLYRSRSVPEWRQNVANSPTVYSKIHTRWEHWQSIASAHHHRVVVIVLSFRILNAHTIHGSMHRW